MAYWLMKSEPGVYSFADLGRDRATDWNGVRNYVSRNHLKAMRPGDEAFFYHSGPAPEIAGVMTVAGAAVPDPGQFDPKDESYDPASPKDAPRWVQVRVAYGRPLASPVTLKRMRGMPGLRRMALFTHTRLSVSPVRPAEWRLILKESSGRGT